jgi:hypothetical protein
MHGAISQSWHDGQRDGISVLDDLLQTGDVLRKEGFGQSLQDAFVQSFAAMVPMSDEIIEVADSFFAIAIAQPSHVIGAHMNPSDADRLVSVKDGITSLAVCNASPALVVWDVG